MQTGHVNVEELKLKSKNAGEPIHVTEKITFAGNEPEIEKALEKVQETLAPLNLGKKDALRVNLLCEESIGMVKALAGDFDAVIWVEKYEKECAIQLRLATEMDLGKRADFINVSTDKKNAASTGFMKKITDIVLAGIMNSGNIAALNQEFDAGSVAYGAMGSYMAAGALANPMASYGAIWSLGSYRDKLDEMEESATVNQAWDELEKSIVASIAKDVIVGIKDKTVGMMIEYNLA